MNGVVCPSANYPPMKWIRLPVNKKDWLILSMERKVLMVALWFVLFILILNLSLSMISASNSIENVIGFLMFVATILISIKTECLTTLKFRKND